MEDIKKIIEYQGNGERTERIDNLYYKWFQYIDDIQKPEAFDTLENISSGLGIEILRRTVSSFRFYSMSMELLRLSIKHRIPIDRRFIDWSKIDYEICLLIKQHNREQLIYDDLYVIIASRETNIHKVVIEQFGDPLRNPERLANLLVDVMGDPHRHQYYDIHSFISLLVDNDQNKKREIMLAFIPAWKNYINESKWKLLPFYWYVAQQFHHASGIPVDKELDSMFLDLIGQKLTDKSLSVIDLITVMMRINDEERIRQIVHTDTFLIRIREFLKNPKIKGYNFIAIKEIYPDRYDINYNGFEETDKTEEDDENNDPYEDDDKAKDNRPTGNIYDDDTYKIKDVFDTTGWYIRTITSFISKYNVL